MNIADVKQGFVPSNQEDNEFAGIPGDWDEEDNWVEGACAGCDEATRQGIGRAKVYWDRTTDGPPANRTEQIRRLVKMIEWAKKDGCTHIVSYHSNVSHKNLDGTWKLQSWYPLINQEADRVAASAAAEWLASLTPGWRWSKPSNRSGDLAFSRRTLPLGSHRSLLWEIGDHAPCVEHGIFLQQYRIALGILAQWGFMKFAGLPVGEPYMPEGVALPPEWAHLAKPVSPPPPVYTRLLKLTTPYMRGEDVRWVQEQLAASLYLVDDDVDGIYGPDTRAAVVELQEDEWPNTPTEWDGIVGPKTFGALQKSDRF